MAKYTELLADYLANGNELPTNFNIIEGFKDLFEAYYIDSELGFETEYLFQIKLQLYADLNMQKYADRITAYSDALGKIAAGSNYKQSTVQVNGEVETLSTDLPYNTASAMPNTRVVSAETTNTNDIEITGFNNNEIMQMTRFYEGKIKDLKQELLNEFKPCFMEVY